MVYRAQAWAVVGTEVSVAMAWHDSEGEPANLATAPTARMYDGPPATYTSTSTTKTALAVSGSAGAGWSATIPLVANQSALSAAGSFVIEWSTGGRVIAETEVYRADRRLAPLSRVKDRAAILADYDDDEEKLALELVEAELSMIISSGTRWESIPPTVRLVRHYEDRWLEVTKRYHRETIPYPWSPDTTDFVAAATAHEDEHGVITTYPNIDLVMTGGRIRQAEWEPFELGRWRFGVITGLQRTPEDLADAMARRYRHWLTQPKSAIPDRATSWTSDAGGTYRLMLPNIRSTGDPAVDAIYKRFSSPSRTGSMLGIQL